jgi:hypothetical protein
VLAAAIQHHLRLHYKFFFPVSQQSGENFIPAVIDPCQQFDTAAALSLVGLLHQN